MYSTDISDAGILHLKSLHNLKHLRVGPDVTEEAAKELRQTIPECRIDAYDDTGTNDFTLGD